MKISLAILSVLAFSTVYGQKEVNPDDGKIDFNRFWSNTIVLPKPDTIISPGFSIADIVIIDNRFDTSTLGFMQRGYPDTRRFLKLKNGTSKEIRDYFLSVFDPSKIDTTSAYTLICIIKKLWLSDEIYTSGDEKKSPK